RYLSSTAREAAHLLCDDVGGERVPGGQCASGLLRDLVPSCEKRKRARTRKPDGCLIRLVMHTPANTDGGALAPSDRPQDHEGTSQTSADDRTGYSIARGDAHVQSHDDHSHSSTCHAISRRAASGILRSPGAGRGARSI